MKPRVIYKEARQGGKTLMALKVLAAFWRLGKSTVMYSGKYDRLKEQR